MDNTIKTKNKKIKNMTIKEINERIGHCIQHNQQNSRYYADIPSRKTVLDSKVK